MVLFRLDEEALALPRARPFSEGSSDDGEFLLRGAPGQPQEECSVRRVVDSGDEYAGKAMLAWVARQERMWKGESMEISKCLRLLGSFTSGFDSLSTIYQGKLALHIVCSGV